MNGRCHLSVTVDQPYFVRQRSSHVSGIPETWELLQELGVTEKNSARDFMR
jgi:hypothetical protein